MQMNESPKRKRRRSESFFSKRLEEISKKTVKLESKIDDTSRRIDIPKTTPSSVATQKFYRSGIEENSSILEKLPATWEVVRAVNIQRFRQSRDEVLFEEFGKLSEALTRYDDLREEFSDARTFAVELNSQGARKYIIATGKSFFLKYSLLSSSERLHSEVIVENIPCNLYFDLEFLRSECITDGNEMVNVLISYCFDVLKRKFGVVRDEVDVVELDSSNSKKFSRHLVFVGEKCAFKNNKHVGTFISSLLQELHSRTEVSKELEVLFFDSVGKETSIPDTFVDVGVYDRNRCFRLVLSSKFQKENPFVIVNHLEDDKREMKNAHEITFEEFMKTLVCRPSNEKLRILECEEHSVSSHSNFSKGGREFSSSTSPFPSVDKFIRNLFCFTENIQNHPLSQYINLRCDEFYCRFSPLQIRKWSLSLQGILTYYVEGNRYCENISREHSSNHVLYCVDIRKNTYVQKCLDPDCRGTGYASHERLIPDEFQPSPLELELYSDGLADQFLSQCHEFDSEEDFRKRIK